ncbi:hypothetical protein GGTG_03140 [Gaeumannomyces tritici R3-111a-1]|uniref:Uncharacterized protein n=1 Tax=Gaeumannomyces tritici (strain R3-111a-1) TaxID=644352 RepID=J3NPD2_GAET3|nr:hypothetical protein GGTG_03140 [Gaeumannomyces tritici R3-111a-1]EJT78037.1 hypothetical protein GGTG_03140 [Gaeumannomyces tritici R3-111a-1]
MSKVVTTRGGGQTEARASMQARGIYSGGMQRRLCSGESPSTKFQTRHLALALGFGRLKALLCNSSPTCTTRRAHGGQAA